MKLIVMTYDLPYPPESGGKTRAYNLLKFLSKSNKITLLSFVREAPNPASIAELKNICDDVKVVTRSKVWTIGNLTRTALSMDPLAINTYKSREMERLIAETLSHQKYDAVLLESFYTSNYADKFPGLKVILGTENLEYLVYRRYVDNVGFAPLRPFMYLDVLKMKRFEEISWSRADIILAVSDRDAFEIKKKSLKPVILVPNGVDIDFFSNLGVKRAAEKRALFVGNWSYIQNTDAAFFLIEEVWPLIKKEIPVLKLWLVGRNPLQKLLKLGTKDIVFVTDADDIRDVYANVDVSLIPIRAASGTRLKALESLASNVPVVSTSIGIEGIEVTNGESVLIADTPKEFAEKVKLVLEDKTLREKMTRRAKQLISQKYSWESIVKNLEKGLENESAR
ncbi:MAG: hypothetical protein A3F33_00575 [Candidatus Woykebacteria bacterium RIFCSPHIGHO2_12_FULL_43_10]|uniref:Glycosyltransferase subfamily 4-like N-terminal domain-containing protein n=1 Tax=Candidatus Woykebacteria bacterium RIFCSPLOWO2_01_FULL_43_14 TaxID=1802605 RepID=A0A1G1WVQ3_9BACT|nr:MAG: hypothetical protein A3F33_00575 [Candidatus Woykebacteria bacterium RIFCSPHIGHO2_12_FULL_43_10]OGY31783.1 MAG: hypothetical protein A3A61_02170 [Candidatus Woykebacteria bacterium RIFCSPLOWO2_01_FULL_43_14]